MYYLRGTEITHRSSKIDGGYIYGNVAVSRLNSFSQILRQGCRHLAIPATQQMIEERVLPRRLPDSEYGGLRRVPPKVADQMPADEPLRAGYQVSLRHVLPDPSERVR